MFVTSTSAKIEILLGAAVTANNVVFVADWIDNTAGSFAPGVTADTVAGTTAVTAIGSPGASTQRLVKSITIYNADTANAAVTVRYYDGSTNYKIVTVTLHTTETLQYIYDAGWFVTDKFGARKQNNSSLCFPHNPLHVAPYLINYAVAGSLMSNTPRAQYIGKAERAYTSVDFRYSVRTAGTSITWAEIGLGTGIQILSPTGATNGTAHIYIRGYTDVAGVVNSLGMKTTTVTLSGVQPGDDLYFVSAAVVTGTAPQLDGYGGETLSSGYAYISATNRRPSTDVNRSVEYGMQTSTNANVVALFS